jgi:hypothetical protein
VGLCLCPQIRHNATDHEQHLPLRIANHEARELIRRLVGMPLETFRLHRLEHLSWILRSRATFLEKFSHGESV